jgi:endonuclease/exonuclease/phosphatase family metal-dependent hydrolase
LILHLKKGKIIIPVLIIHFKATSSRLFTDEENTVARSLRYRQALIANHWVDSVMNKAMRKELIILGDFNDYIKSAEDSTNTLLPLASNKNLIFVTKFLNSCKYKKLKSIDQIVVSKALKRKLKSNSTRMFDFNMILPDSKVSKISDHCPVILELNLD